MPEDKGATNAYPCRTCSFVIVTINRDEGTTPFMIGACRNPTAPDGCQGPMRSSFYRLPPNAPEPTWEWYSPTDRERRRLDAWERDHVERGGLLLREIRP